MKRWIACMLMLVCVWPFAACAERGHYTDDVPTDEIADALTALLNKSTDLPLQYVKDDTDFTSEYFTLPDYVKEHSIFYARSTSNINELGIYHVEAGYAKQLATRLKSDYLAASYDKNRAWYDSYIPTETPKLRDAEVRTFGNYVVYAILDADDRKNVFDTVKTLLKQ